MITTAKIKEVVSVKPFTNSHGTTQYHCLVMDNGDEINIGKKDVQKIGYELTYELTGGDEGQQRFKKAKAAKKTDGVTPSGSSPATAQTDPTVWRKKDVAIIMQNAFTQANAFHGVVGFGHKEPAECLKILTETADLIAQHVIKKSGL